MTDSAHLRALLTGESEEYPSRAPDWTTEKDPYRAAIYDHGVVVYQTDPTNLDGIRRAMAAHIELNYLDLENAQRVIDTLRSQQDPVHDNGAWLVDLDTSGHVRLLIDTIPEERP